LDALEQRWRGRITIALFFAGRAKIKRGRIPRKMLRSVPSQPRVEIMPPTFEMGMTILLVIVVCIAVAINIFGGGGGKDKWKG
jgi:hypothetical protein